MKLLRLINEEWSADELVKFERLCDKVSCNFIAGTALDPSHLIAFGLVRRIGVLVEDHELPVSDLEDAAYVASKITGFGDDVLLIDWAREYASRERTWRLCSVRSGNLASPRAGVYPGAGRSVILVIHESVQTNMENQYAERPG